MEQVIVLEWLFSPPNYFEQTIELTRREYTLRIESGKVEARVDSLAYDANPNYRLALHESLNDRFLAIQVFTHRTYNLSKPTMYRLHPDGRRDVTVFLEGVQIKAIAGSLDVLVKDTYGNIITDTKKDRIEKNEQVANLAEKYCKTDQVLAALLNSYAAAVRDPDNELVHLYEIREAVSQKFGNESSARDALRVNRSDMSRLRQLANDEPLNQGRHRGKKVGNLRDATEVELNEARFIARLIVDRYLTWLDKNG